MQDHRRKASSQPWLLLLLLHSFFPLVEMPPPILAKGGIKNGAHGGPQSAQCTYHKLWCPTYCYYFTDSSGQRDAALVKRSISYNLCVRYKGSFGKIPCMQLNCKGPVGREEVGAKDGHPYSLSWQLRAANGTDRWQAQMTDRQARSRGSSVQNTAKDGHLSWQLHAANGIDRRQARMTDRWRVRDADADELTSKRRNK
jgi:hypothetical protein